MKKLLLIIIILLIGVSIWAYNADELQIHAVKSYMSNMSERVTDVDISAFEEFVFVTTPNFLNRYLLKPFISLLGAALGGAFSLPFIPAAMKEHFTASPRRVVSFFFLMLMILAVIKFLAKILGLDEVLKYLKEKFIIFCYKLINLCFGFSVADRFYNLINVGQKFYDMGHDEGYSDGRWHKCEPKNLVQRWYEKNRIKSIFNYVLLIILVFELMLAMSSDPNFNLTDLDSVQPSDIAINHSAAVSPDISN